MTALLVPGLRGADKGHWQRWWLAKDERARLVVQDDREHPNLHEWQSRIVEAVAAAPGAILVAHGLGCALVAHIGRGERKLDIAGALLVAPADADDKSRVGAAGAAFAPMPLQPLRFPTAVVASRSDRSVNFARAYELSLAWRSKFIDLGDAGHIDTASGFGPWPLGLQLFEELHMLSELLRSAPGFAPAASLRAPA